MYLHSYICTWPAFETYRNVKQQNKVYTLSPRCCHCTCDDTPVINGYMMQSKNIMISSLKIVTTLLQVMYN